MTLRAVEPVRVGDDFLFDYTVGGVCLEVSGITDNRSGFSAWLTVRKSGGKLSWGKIRLDSARDRDALAQTLTAAYADFPWADALGQVAETTYTAWRAGEPTVRLSDVVASPTPQYLVDPLLPLNETTILYGDGDAGKSSIALWLSLLVSMGINAPGAVTQYRCPVLYLDWETTSETHSRRLSRLAQGLIAQGPFDVYYRRVVRPLVDEVRAIQHEIHRFNIALVVVDSMGFCVGGGESINDASVATSAMNALRSLGVTRLALHHMSHETAKSPGGPSAPSGCYADDTEVLTHDGWRLHEDLSVGEEVLAFNTAGVFRWEEIQHVHRYPYSGEMVRFKGRGFDALVTPNHRMLLQYDSSYTPQGLGPSLPRGWQFQEASTCVGGSTRHTRTGSRWLMPYANPVEESLDSIKTITVGDTEYPGDDFLRFLGFWLSEGWVPANDRAPMLAQEANTPVAERMRDCLERLGVDFGAKVHFASGADRSHHKPMLKLRLKNARQLADWLVENCGRLQPVRRIPRFVFSAPREQRALLMDTLLDGDGSGTAEDSSCCYHTTSPWLADDVAELAILLGWSANIASKPPGLKGNYPRFRVNMNRHRTMGIIKSRHVFSEEYSGEVWCLTVPSGAYLTRRNGLMMVAGNSRYFRNGARALWEIRRSVVSPQTANVGLYSRKMNDDAPREEPIAWQIDYGETRGGAIRLSKITLEDDPGLRANMALVDQIAWLLRKGSLPATTIADETGAAADAVRKILKTTGRFVQIGDGPLWGLKVPRSYGTEAGL